MNLIYGSAVTCLFEIRRSMTFQRIAVSTVLALFPPTMIFIVLMILRASALGGFGFIEFFIVTLVSLTTLLSLLLWATPNVYTELEGKSWIFLASRPGGRLSVLLGKYLTAVISSFAVAFVAVTTSICVAQFFAPMEDPLYTWFCFSLIFLLACMGYAAVFSAIGTFFFKRSMVIAVAYLIGWECLLASFPAVINRFSLRYHLQSTGVYLMGDFFPKWLFDGLGYASIYGTPDLRIHLLAIFGVVAVFIGIGSFIIVTKQYITSDEAN